MQALAQSSFAGVRLTARAGPSSRPAAVAVALPTRCLKDTVGVVESVGMQKTIKVRVERQFADPMYIKQRTTSTAFLVHDETNACKVGDRVKIVSCQPLSKRKHYRVSGVCGKNGECTPVPQ